MYMAKWGPKGFLVSPEKIVTFDGFSTSIALKSDSTNDTSGTAPTNTKGREPQTVSMSINYVRAAGVDPRAQFDEWSSLVGQANPLYIGDVPFGPDLLMLTKVDLSDLQLAPDGKFISAKIAVSFDEYIKPKPVIRAVQTSTASNYQKTNTEKAITPEMEQALMSAPDLAKIDPAINKKVAVLTGKNTINPTPAITPASAKKSTAYVPTAADKAQSTQQAVSYFAPGYSMLP